MDVLDRGISPQLDNTCSKKHTVDQLKYYIHVAELCCSIFWWKQAVILKCTCTCTHTHTHTHTHLVTHLNSLSLSPLSLSLSLFPFLSFLPLTQIIASPSSLYEISKSYFFKIHYTLVQILKRCYQRKFGRSSECYYCFN